MDSSPIDLTVIKGRVDAATEGPWFLDFNGADHAFVGNRADGRQHGLWEIVHMSGDKLGDFTPEAAKRELANAEFIAHARTDIPALIAQLRHLDAALTELVHHGDLTPDGAQKLRQILGGE